MGCDIHMYVEYKSKERFDDYWTYFWGKINPGRNYWMFGLIAKVRGSFKESFNPKGMPNNASYVAEEDNYVYITKEGIGDNECTIEQAKKWERYGCKISYHCNIATKVTHPDWHSHTWLTTEEFEYVIDCHNKMKGAQREPQYEALLASMKKLEELGNDVRVICWFDN